MRRFKPERAHYIPSQPHTVQQDAESSAVAYLYADKAGRPCAVAFSGKRAKPDWRFYFASEERRAERIAQHAQSTRQSEAFRAKLACDRKADRRRAANLDFAGKDYLSAADTAALCRQSLAEAFPGHKISVRSDGSLRVRWTDGPSVKAVEQIAGMFAGSYFDGMIDYRGSLYHSLDGRRVHFGADFVFCERELSPAAEAVALAAYEAAEPSRRGAVQLGEVDSWGRAALIVDGEHGQVLAGRFPGEFEIECAPGREVACSRFAEPRRALATWWDHAQQIEPQPSPTFARVSLLGSDGYGNTPHPVADGGEGGRGYPQPKEPEPDPAALAAAADLRRELSQAEAVELARRKLAEAVPPHALAILVDLLALDAQRAAGRLN